MSVKDLFVVDEAHTVTNTIAGISVLLTFTALHYFINPIHDVPSFIIDLLIALVIGGIAYLVREFIRKKTH